MYLSELYTLYVRLLLSVIFNIGMKKILELDLFLLPK